MNKEENLMQCRKNKQAIAVAEKTISGDIDEGAQRLLRKMLGDLSQKNDQLFKKFQGEEG